MKVFGLLILEGVTEIKALSSGAMSIKLPGELLEISTETILEESDNPSAV